MRSVSFITLAVSLLLSSCVAFQVSRLEVDAHIEVEPFECFEPGKTTIGEVADALGPPDYMLFRWDEQGDPFTRFDYIQRKSRSSDVLVTVPLDQIRRLNSLLAFIAVLSGIVRGEIPYQDDFERLGVTFESTYKSNTQSSNRLSEKRNSNNGRTESMNDITGRPEVNPHTSGSLPSLLVPLELLAEGLGSDHMRLEFDKMGILTRKEMRKGTPDTSVGSQITDTLLQ